MLYQATKSPFYLHVGKEILTSLNNFTKAKCGYATVHDVETKTLEDRQESFFLSETCKYLYLLFDVGNPLNKMADQYIFTTEGHVFPIRPQMRLKAWGEDYYEIPPVTFSKPNETMSQDCLNQEKSWGLPLQEDYLAQIFNQVGAELS